MKKGITLITLIVMVIIMMILATTVTITGVNAMNNSKKMKFASELLFMQETIDNYIADNSGNLPINGPQLAAANLPEGEYYEIDMSLLGLIETTYGIRLNNDIEDIYVVSKTSNTVYYLKGLKIGNKVYYTLDDELKNIIDYTDTKILSKDGIVFTPSETNYTNQEINVKVQIPVEYSEVSVLSQNIQVTEFTTEDKYNVYNVSKSSNYDIVVSYTKNSKTLKQVYTVSNYDGESPSIEITNTTTLNDNKDTKTSITIATSDNLSGVSKVLYEVDNVEKSYFETENKGKVVTNNNVVVDKFTKYVTFYVVDKAGNSQILLKTLNPTATEDDYVDYGLILHYDAINNTGNGHSSTTTVWKDLSGNGNNGTLINFDSTETSGWSDNGLTLDGIDDYVTTKNVVDYKATNAITIEFVDLDGILYLNRNNGKIFAIIESSSNFNANKNGFLIDAFEHYNNGMTAAINFDNYYLKKYNNMIENKNTVYTYILDIKNKTTPIIKLYKNSELIYEEEETLKGSNYDYFENYELYIGSRGGKNLFSNLKIGNLKIYNRALTEDEITQNYNIDKIRFGI